MKNEFDNDDNWVRVRTPREQDKAINLLYCLVAFAIALGACAVAL